MLNWQEECQKFTPQLQSVATVSYTHLDIGPEAGLPVMEGKAVLFKEFGGVDAFPI